MGNTEKFEMVRRWYWATPVTADMAADKQQSWEWLERHLATLDAGEAEGEQSTPAAGLPELPPLSERAVRGDFEDTHYYWRDTNDVGRMAMKEANGLRAECRKLHAALTASEKARVVAERQLAEAKSGFWGRVSARAINERNTAQALLKEAEGLLEIWLTTYRASINTAERTKERLANSRETTAFLSRSQSEPCEARSKPQPTPIPNCACGHLWAHHGTGGAECLMCSCEAYKPAQQQCDGSQDHANCADTGTTDNLHRRLCAVEDALIREGLLTIADPACPNRKEVGE